MNRRALLLSALAAAMVPPADARALVRIRVDCSEFVPVARELCELLPLATDCDVGTRAGLVQLFEDGQNFFDTLDLHRTSAFGARERLICLQPSRLLLDCVSALRAGRRDSRATHQGHIESSKGRLATPMVDGRARGVEYLRLPGRGHSSVPA